MKNWSEFLEQEKKEKYFIELMEKVNKAYEATSVYPPKDELFSCFDLCKYEDLKVVIIGQDPYHGEGQAHGLSFSVKPGVKVPPSLKNIYKELKTDLGIDEPSHGYLVSWATQGVLLMNTSWTVEAGKAASHKSFGWKKFTARLLDEINSYEKPIVFILWGNHAIEAAKGITNPIHHLVKGIHPSPLAGGGFFGSKPFSKTNELLESDGRGAIDWRIPALATDADGLSAVKKTTEKVSGKSDAAEKPVAEKSDAKKQKAEKPTPEEAVKPTKATAVPEEFFKVKISETLTRFKENNKYGLMDNDGKIVVEPIYDRIFPITKNFIRVKSKGLFGLLNHAGKVVQETKYAGISTHTPEGFESGFEVSSRVGNGWLNENAEEIIPPKYHKYEIFNENYYLCSKEDYGKQELIDKKGNAPFTRSYHRIEECGDGYIRIYDDFGAGYKWALFSPEAKPLTKFMYGDMKSFENGYMRVIRNEDSLMLRPGVTTVNPNKQWNFIDKNGKEVSEENYEDVGDFSEGLAAVKLNDKLGFIDTTGKVVIPFQYDVAAVAFENGICRVFQNSKAGVIDAKGNTIIPFEYDALGKFNNGYAIYFLNDELNEQVGYIDADNNKFALCLDEIKKRWIYKGKDGKTAPIENISNLRPNIENSISFALNGKWGYCDDNGTIFIDAIYEDCSSCFWGDIAFAKKDGKWGFIDRTGKELTGFVFNNAGFIMAGYGMGELEDGKMVLVNKNGIVSKPYVSIGYSRDIYSYEKKKRFYSAGMDWMWYTYLDKWVLTDRLEDKYVSDDINYSVFKEDDFYDVPFIEANDPYDKLNKDGNICTSNDFLSNTLSLKPGTESLFKGKPPIAIEKAKIKGAKAKMNPNFSSSSSPYYLNDHHNKVYDYVDGIQNRFYVSLCAAISEWALWRLYENIHQYIDFEMVFKRVDALYTVGSGVIDVKSLKLGYNSKLQENAKKNYSPSEQELEEIYALYKLILHIDDLFSKRVFYRNVTVQFVVFVRLILSGTKKTDFNDWLDSVLKKGRNFFTTKVPYSDYKGFETDDFVPREFFFDESYEYTLESGLMLYKNLIDNLDYDNNPYLKKPNSIQI